MSGQISRVSVLANPTVKRWEMEALEKLVDETDIEITKVIVNRSAETSGVLSRDFDGVIGNLIAFIQLFRETGPWAIVLAQRKILRKLFDVEQYMFEDYEIESVSCLQDAEFIYCEPIPTRSDTLDVPNIGDVWKTLPDDVVDDIAEHSDVAVRFGFGLIEGRILEDIEYGVLSFHSSDFRKYRGLASTERYLDGQDQAGMTLQRLTSDIDGGAIVAYDTVDITSCYLQDEINNRLKERQTEMLLEGIKNLSSGETIPSVPDDLAEYTSTKKKKNWVYCGRLLVAEARNAFRKALA